MHAKCLSRWCTQALPSSTAEESKAPRRIPWSEMQLERARWQETYASVLKLFMSAYTTLCNQMFMLGIQEFELNTSVHALSAWHKNAAHCIAFWFPSQSWRGRTSGMCNLSLQPQDTPSESCYVFGDNVSRNDIRVGRKATALDTLFKYTHVWIMIACCDIVGTHSDYI